MKLSSSLLLTGLMLSLPKTGAVANPSRFFPSGGEQVSHQLHVEWPTDSYNGHRLRITLWDGDRGVRTIIAEDVDGSQGSLDYELSPMLQGEHFRIEVEANGLDKYASPAYFSITPPNITSGVATRQALSLPTPVAYPNPGSNVVHLILPASLPVGDYQLSVANSLGKIIYTNAVVITSGSVTELSLDCKTWPAGSYPVALSNGTARTTTTIKVIR